LLMAIILGGGLLTISKLKMEVFPGNNLSIHDLPWSCSGGSGRGSMR
jgi:hypothetical protein